MSTQLAAETFIRLLHHVQHRQHRKEYARCSASEQGGAIEQGTLSSEVIGHQELYDPHLSDVRGAAYSPNASVDGFAPLNIGPSSSVGDGHLKWRRHPWTRCALRFGTVEPAKGITHLHFQSKP